MGKLAIGGLEGAGLEEEKRREDSLGSLYVLCILSSLFIPECIHLAQLESQISQTEEKHENRPVW